MYNMCVYVLVCIYIYIYIYICTHTHTHTHIHIHTHIIHYLAVFCADNNLNNSNVIVSCL